MFFLSPSQFTIKQFEANASRYISRAAAAARCPVQFRSCESVSFLRMYLFRFAAKGKIRQQQQLEGSGKSIRRAEINPNRTGPRHILIPLGSESLSSFHIYLFSLTSCPAPLTSSLPSFHFFFRFFFALFAARRDNALFSSTPALLLPRRRTFLRSFHMPRRVLASPAASWKIRIEPLLLLLPFLRLELMSLVVPFFYLLFLALLSCHT